MEGNEPRRFRKYAGLQSFILARDRQRTRKCGTEFRFIQVSRKPAGNSCSGMKEKQGYAYRVFPLVFVSPKLGLAGPC